VKGETMKSTLAEAVLISPIIFGNLQTNPMNREFHFSNDELSPKIFEQFIELIRHRDRNRNPDHGSINFSIEHKLDFLLVCRSLGNERLSLIFLDSIHSNHSNLTSTVNESQSNVSGMIEIDMKGEYYESCASQFYSYSTDELRTLSKQTLHKILSSESLAIESEDTLLLTLIDLGCDYCDFWCYIEISFLSDDGISRFVDTLSFEELTMNLWCKIVSRLIGFCDEDFRMRRCRCHSHSHPHLPHTSNESVIESMIISNVPSSLKRFEQNEWILLYRGSRDGFKGSTFHSKCDGQSNTVTVILTTKDFIFGGFTPIPWDSSNSSNSWKTDNSQQSFIFSVKDSRNSEPKCFPLVNSSLAIYCGSSYGPTFGGGHDIYVADGCNQNSSNTNLGHTYRNDTGLQNTEVLNGEYHFQVKEIEVFSITL
jgi:hypothetical protein